MKHLDHCLGYVIWPELQEFSGVGQDISLEKNLAKHHEAHEHVQRHLATGLAQADFIAQVLGEGQSTLLLSVTEYPVS